MLPRRPATRRRFGRPTWMSCSCGEATRSGYAQPVRSPRLFCGAFLLPLDLQRDVDELVFLTADQLALTGPVQQLVGRNAVALGLPDGVLEEAGVDAGVAHDQRVAVEQALGRPCRRDNFFRGVGD